MPEYATFAKFYTAEEAEPLLTLLSENNIQYKIRQERNQIDSIIIGSSLDPMLAVDIPVEQFRAASELNKNFQADASIPDSPERLDTKWIIFGYAISLLSFVGLLAGLVILTSSKRLSDGRKTKIYDEYTRSHGRVMLLLAVIATIFWTVNRVFLVPGGFVNYF
ncbi:MAG: hypothetical protein JNK79_11025 [Chitinophagaceae bacterium]|nr:hypothetical protein [Chitinophagaceae bacterium]